MGLDEIVKTSLYDLRMLVLENDGEERTYGHELPPDKEHDKVVGCQQDLETEQGEEEREPVEGKLASVCLIVRQICCTIDCADGEQDTDNQHEP